MNAGCMYTDYLHNVKPGAYKKEVGISINIKAAATHDEVVLDLDKRLTKAFQRRRRSTTCRLISGLLIGTSGRSLRRGVDTKDWKMLIWPYWTALSGHTPRSHCQSGKIWLWRITGSDTLEWGCVWGRVCFRYGDMVTGSSEFCSVSGVGFLYEIVLSGVMHPG